jgi:membrane-associated protease RseP (regulator of RpoE activity)
VTERQRISDKHGWLPVPERESATAAAPPRPEAHALDEQLANDQFRHVTIAHLAVIAVLAAATILFLPRWRLLYAWFALLTLVVVAHLLPCVIWARWRRIGIITVGIYFGASLVRFRIWGIPVRINWIPTGGYVKLRGTDEPNTPLPGTYNALPRWERAAMNLAMPLGTLLVGFVSLGPSRAMHSLLFAFRSLVVGAGQPQTAGLELVARLFDPLANGEVVASLGRVAIVMTAINLLPISIVNGGIALLELISAVVPISLRARAILDILSLLIACGLLTWTYSMYLYLSRMP